MLPQCGGGWVEGMKARQRHKLFVRRGNHAHLPGNSGGPAVAVLVKETGELIETALGLALWDSSSISGAMRLPALPAHRLKRSELGPTKYRNTPPFGGGTNCRLSVAPSVHPGSVQPNGSIAPDSCNATVDESVTEGVLDRP